MKCTSAFILLFLAPLANADCGAKNPWKLIHKERISTTETKKITGTRGSTITVCRHHYPIGSHPEGYVKFDKLRPIDLPPGSCETHPAEKALIKSVAAATPCPHPSCPGSTPKVSEGTYQICG